jgi:hypothetical protein
MSNSRFNLSVGYWRPDQATTHSAETAITPDVRLPTLDALPARSDASPRESCPALPIPGRGPARIIEPFRPTCPILSINPTEPEKGSKLMDLRRPTEIASAFVLTLIILVGMPGTASAWEHRCHTGKGYRPSVGYAVPIQNVYQFPAAMVDQPTLPTGYAVPIQAVYQFPATVVNQPGAYGPFAAPARIDGPALGHRVFPR